MKFRTISCVVLLFTSCTSQAESLADIYKQALLNDPTYRQAEVEFNIGKNSTYKAWASFLPKLNLDPQGSYQRAKGADLDQTLDGVDNPTIPGGTFITRSANIGRLSFNLGINEWFTFKNNLMGDELAQLSFAREQQNLIIRVTERYFAVLQAQAQLQIAQKTQHQKRLELELAEERLAEGLNTITDIHTAKTGYYQAQIDSQQRMVNMDLAFEALTLLTGRAHYSLSGFGEQIPAPDPSPLDAEQWVRSAVQDSYDVQIKKIERERARNDSRTNKYFYLPTVRATLNGSSYSSSPSSTQIRPIPITNPDGTTSFIDLESINPATRSIREGGNSVNITLSIPLFGDNGLSLIDRREKAQREQISQESFLKSYRQAEFDVRSSFMNILNQKRRLKLQEQLLEQAQLAYDKTKIEYEHGSKSLIDLTSQQTSLLNARVTRTDAKYNYIQTLLKLKQEAGKLTPEDIFEIDSWLKEENSITATKRLTTMPDSVEPITRE